MAVETGGPGWACLPSQFLAYQLTYFSLGADYITVCPPPLEFSDLLMAKLIALWIPKEQLYYELSKKTPHELSKSSPSFPMYFFVSFQHVLSSPLCLTGTSMSLWHLKFFLTNFKYGQALQKALHELSKKLSMSSPKSYLWALHKAIHELSTIDFLFC